MLALLFFTLLGSCAPPLFPSVSICFLFLNGAGFVVSGAGTSCSGGAFGVCRVRAERLSGGGRVRVIAEGCRVPRWDTENAESTESMLPRTGNRSAVLTITNKRCRHFGIIIVSPVGHQTVCNSP
jgi:hypothetical protein